MLVLVGNYARTAQTTIQIKLPIKVPSMTLDLRSGEPLVTARPLALDVDPGDFFLVYVKGRQ